MTPESDSTSSSALRRRPRTLWIILAVLGLGAIAAGAALFWFNRPIQATVLTPQEREILTEKVAAVEQARDEPTYEAGERKIVLSERELNGLLNDNTPLGEQLKLELATDAVHARLNADIPEDFPIMAGKKLKGKARFIVKSDTGTPTLILDDLTIWGISVPNAWLGDIKGRDLLGSILPGAGGGGFEEIRVENGSLVIELAE